MSEFTIEEAIRRVRAGNLEEFRAVVVAFHQRLRTAIAAACPPGVEADEIAHLAFLHAYRHIDEYRADTNFFAWLLAIARNLLRTEYAQRKRRATNEQNYLEHLVTQRLDYSVSRDTGVAETLAQFLADCLAELKLDARSAFELRYRDGLPVKIIADRLARSATAVNVELFRLRKLLHACVARKQAQFSANPNLQP